MSYDATESAASQRSVKSPMAHRELSQEIDDPNTMARSPQHYETRSLAGSTSSSKPLPPVTSTNIFSSLLHLGKHRDGGRSESGEGSRHSMFSEAESASVADDENRGSIHFGLEQIISRPRKQSYEDIAVSLANSTPQQFYAFEGRAKITVKIIYSPSSSSSSSSFSSSEIVRQSETKTMSLRALLLDILNEAQRYEDEAKHIQKLQSQLKRNSPHSTAPDTTTIQDSLHHSTPPILERTVAAPDSAPPPSSLRRHGTVLINKPDSSKSVATSSTNQPVSQTSTSSPFIHRTFITPLRQRDLRRLEASTYSTQYNQENGTSNGGSKPIGGSLPEQDPYVVIRQHVVLFSFGELVSAVVQADRLILIVHHQADGAEAALDQLERHILEWIRSPHLLQTAAVTTVDVTTLSASPSAADVRAVDSIGRNHAEVSTQHPFSHYLDNPANPTTAGSAVEEQAGHLASDAASTTIGAISSTLQQLPFSFRVYDALFATMYLVLQREVDLSAGEIDTLCTAIGTHSLLALPVQEALRLVKGRLTLLRQRALGYVRLLGAMTLDNSSSGNTTFVHGGGANLGNFQSPDLSPLVQGADPTMFNKFPVFGASSSGLGSGTGSSSEAYFAFLNLPALRQQPDLYESPLPQTLAILDTMSLDLDFMLEGHFSDFQALAQRIRGLDQRVSDVEDMVSLRLDISRNELLVASTVLSVFACTIGFAGFITGAFGMNLDNSEELSAIRGLFGGVFGGCILIIIVSTVSVLQYFRAKGILPTHTSVRWANVGQIIQQKNA